MNLLHLDDEKWTCMIYFLAYYRELEKRERIKV